MYLNFLHELKSVFHSYVVVILLGGLYKDTISSLSGLLVLFAVFLIGIEMAAVSNDELLWYMFCSIWNSISHLTMIATPPWLSQTLSLRIMWKLGIVTIFLSLSHVSLTVIMSYLFIIFLSSLNLFSNLWQFYCSILILFSSIFGFIGVFVVELLYV